MGFHKELISTFIKLGLCASLLACAGSSSVAPGGPPSAVGVAPLVGGQNTFGGSNGSEGANPGSGGDLPGGETAQGQAVPSTQQSDPAVGGPCFLHFVVIVKTLRNGVELSCRGDSMTINRKQAADILSGDNSGTMAPPEEPGPGPDVTFHFNAQSYIEERVVKASTSCTAGGQWQTQREDLGFYFIPDGIDCSKYSAKSHANWNWSGAIQSSDTFSGPPVPDVDENLRAVPITLTIDLGTTHLEVDTIQVFGH